MNYVPQDLTGGVTHFKSQVSSDALWQEYHANDAVFFLLHPIGGAQFQFVAFLVMLTLFT